ncbi:NAD(P)H-dependent oxidoreductase [Sciscionella sediminilitoris]|uniref:NAD(P)H-dependent oxidoreductase n=1 Tax=Sciscionella sediminilitoris TaxID=1445613 RepID=UPI0004DF359B|nr:NAD(P)H-dependent oxidoreductase [Sciscionella sp. SE31]
MTSSEPNGLRAVIVTAHPDPHSATMGTASAVREGLRGNGCTEVVHRDLVATGFDPVFGAGDLHAYRGDTALPADVRAEQRFLEGFDLIVLVFPVHWWSLPAALKGWIDRVFTRGWAYDDTGAGIELTAARNLYFVGIGGAGPDLYERRGYANAMRTTLVDGIGGYLETSGSNLILLHDGEAESPEQHRRRDEAAREAGASIGQSVACLA